MGENRIENQPQEPKSIKVLLNQRGSINRGEIEQEDRYPEGGHQRTSSTQLPRTQESLPKIHESQPPHESLPKTQETLPRSQSSQLPTEILSQTQDILPRSQSSQLPTEQPPIDHLSQPPTQSSSDDPNDSQTGIIGRVTRVFSRSKRLSWGSQTAKPDQTDKNIEETNHDYGISQEQVNEEADSNESLKEGHQTPIKSIPDSEEIHQDSREIHQDSREIHQDSREIHPESRETLLDSKETPSKETPSKETPSKETYSRETPNDSQDSPIQPHAEIRKSSDTLTISAARSSTKVPARPKKSKRSDSAQLITFDRPVVPDHSFDLDDHGHLGILGYLDHRAPSRVRDSYISLYLDYSAQVKHVDDKGELRTDAKLVLSREPSMKKKDDELVSVASSVPYAELPTIDASAESLKLHPDLSYNTNIEDAIPARSPRRPLLMTIDGNTPSPEDSRDFSHQAPDYNDIGRQYESDAGLQSDFDQYTDIEPLNSRRSASVSRVNSERDRGVYQKTHGSRRSVQEYPSVTELPESQGNIKTEHPQERQPQRELSERSRPERYSSGRHLGLQGDFSGIQLGLPARGLPERVRLTQSFQESPQRPPSLRSQKLPRRNLPEGISARDKLNEQELPYVPTGGPHGTRFAQDQIIPSGSSKPHKKSTSQETDDEFYDVGPPEIISKPLKLRKSLRKKKKLKELKPFTYSTLINLLESMNGTVIGEEFSKLNLPMREKQLIEKIVDLLLRLTLDMVIDESRYEVGIGRLEKALRVLEGFN